MAYFLKTKIWQTGQLEWWGWIDNEDCYLGKREFPEPPEEGDEWTVQETGETFRVINMEICRISKND